MWQPRPQLASPNRERILRYIDDMYEKITVDDDDKKRSRAYVDETLREIIGHVRGQEYGDIYGHQIIKAGSYPINAKIGKADEFDTNIIFNIEPKKLFEKGRLIYTFEANFNQANLQADVNLVRTTYPSNYIPNGYVVVEVDSRDAPPYFRHEEPMMVGTLRTCLVINQGISDENIHVVPRDVKQDLHKKIKAAKTALNLDGVSVSNVCHGPALTLTITPDQRSDISHKISVDVTVSLKCSLAFKDWPRVKTCEAFDESLIAAAKEAGIHLVPKKDLFWAISYSRAERALLSSIDRRFGCRKRVLKLLKKYLAICQSRSASKLPGMSSHVLKTQVLWSCELHADESDYWHYDNRDICLANTMSELVTSLRQVDLPDYFNTSVNILQGKDPSVRAELADFLTSEWNKLKQM